MFPSLVTFLSASSSFRHFLKKSDKTVKWKISFSSSCMCLFKRCLIHTQTFTRKMFSPSVKANIVSVKQVNHKHELINVRLNVFMSVLCV